VSRAKRDYMQREISNIDSHIAASMEDRSAAAFSNLRHIDVFEPECPGHQIMDVIAKKWTVLIIYALTQGSKRYFELERQIHGVTPKVLARCCAPWRQKELSNAPCIRQYRQAWNIP
jgi:hypothetical protein